MQSANFRLLAATAFLSVALLPGCVATKVTYSPKEQMVTLDKHNGVMELGPCGMPWNYDDHFVILFQQGLDRCDASQMAMYQHGKLTIESGFVSINRVEKKVSIDLTLLALDGVQRVVRPFPHNGTFDYVEEDPSPGMTTKKWLQDFYRDKKPVYYICR